MSTNLPRVTQKIFGENAGQNIGQFGSALAGQGNPTGDIEEIQALPAWEGGWNSAVISERDYPPLEEMTGIQKVETQQIAYLMQKGIPEWDAGTTYFANVSFCQINGLVYRSLTDNNLGNNPATDTTNWEVWKPLEGNYANTDLSNLTATGEKHFLNKTQLSNCILEIPQNINLVDNGTNIIIKAGTIGIKPNGFEADGSTPKVDYITVTADITLENNQTTTVMLGLNGAQNVYRTPINRCFSGPTAPESPVNLTIWYDTSTNLVKRYVNSAWSVENFTLPLGILNYTASGTPGSIEQVFNGMGYIGSTLWVNGLTLLLSSGLNADGTKNNTQFVPSMAMFTVSAGSRTNRAIVIDSANSMSDGSIAYRPDLGFGEYDSSVSFTIRGDNYIVTATSASRQPKRAVLGRISYADNLITDFAPFSTISAADDQTVLHKYGNETAYGDKNFAGNLTVSGTLNANDVNINGLLTINSDTLDIANTVAPSTNQAYVLADIRDKNNVVAGSIRYIEQTSGKKYMEVLCGKTLNGATSYSQFLVGKTVSGRNFVQAPASDIINSVITTTGISKAANGYLTLGNGIIIQWGSIGAVTVNQNLTTSFNTSFTVAPKVVVSVNGSWSNQPTFTVAAVTTSNFTVHLSSNGNDSSGCAGFYFAIGY